MKRCACRNPSSGLLSQFVMGIVTSAIVAFVFDAWRSNQARAALPQPPASGQDKV